MKAGVIFTGFALGERILSFFRAAMYRLQTQGKTGADRFSRSQGVKSTAKRSQAAFGICRHNCRIGMDKYSGSMGFSVQEEIILVDFAIINS